MKHLNIKKLRDARLNGEPFPYVVVPGFLTPESVNKINGTFPLIDSGGSYPIEDLTPQMAISEVIQELDSPDFEQVVSEKFDIDLSSRPKMYSLRGYSRRKDGGIHTDSKDKLITVLLYLNEPWNEDGGRLRLLYDGDDINNYFVEIPPDNGTLLVFERSDNSWHGHLPFQGQRRALQMNWMVDRGKRHSHILRHRISKVLKRAAANIMGRAEA